MIVYHKGIKGIVSLLYIGSSYHIPGVVVYKMYVKWCIAIYMVVVFVVYASIFKLIVYVNNT